MPDADTLITADDVIAEIDTAGDCVVWNDSGTFRFMVCQGGTTWNKG